MACNNGPVAPAAVDVSPSMRLVGQIAQLRAWLRAESPVAIAFSGGADSALLAYVAASTDGVDAVSITAVSPSLATQEFDDCAALADEWNLKWLTVETDEMLDAAYRQNDLDRCFHCKSALMRAFDGLRDHIGTRTLLLGVNTDDLNDHRPGQEAALLGGARFPFVELAMSKADVREISRYLGLRTWDKPAAPCLASRVPYGTEVTVELLGRVERAESCLRACGIRTSRVRHHGEVARIEVQPDDFDRVISHRERIESEFRSIGFRYVALDLGGLRSGSLNPPKV